MSDEKNTQKDDAQVAEPAAPTATPKKKMSGGKKAAIAIVIIAAICVAAVLIYGQVSKTHKNPVIRVSTTTSVNDSGLLPYLQPTFEADTGYKLEITSAGTGAAIAKGTSGDADVLLVHAKSQEETFISSGYGVERIPFMYNYFVVVGPNADPAGVKGTTTASDAFTKIADSNSIFISRGDNSGTNTKETAIWQSTGITPDGQSWYVSAGQGMGACLNIANEQQAYVLSDKATFLKNKSNLSSLSILLESADDMKNTYSLIAVSPDKYPDENYEGAQAFIKWMTSDKAQKLITSYGVKDYGEQLFYWIDK